MFTSHRIPLFLADGNTIGDISEMALSALIDSGILNRCSTPAASLTPATKPLCIECGEHRCSAGIFCACCFSRLKNCDAGWAAAWYGTDWQEAVEIASREVQG